MREEPRAPAPGRATVGVHDRPEAADRSPRMTPGLAAVIAIAAALGFAGWWWLAVP